MRGAKVGEDELPRSLADDFRCRILNVFLGTARIIGAGARAFTEQDRRLERRHSRHGLVGLRAVPPMPA